MDERVDRGPTFPKASAVLAAPVASLLQRVEPNIRRLVEGQSEVDAEPDCEGLGIGDAGRGRIVVFLGEKKLPCLSG